MDSLSSRMLPPCDAVLLLNGGHIFACIVLAVVATSSAAGLPPRPQHLGISKPRSWLDFSRLALILLGAAADWAAPVLSLSSGDLTSEGVSASAGFAVVSWTCLLAVWLVKGRGMAMWAIIEMGFALPHLMVLVLDNGEASVAPIAATAIRFLLPVSLASNPASRGVDPRESGQQRAGKDVGWEAEAREALLPPDHLQVAALPVPSPISPASVQTLGVNFSNPTIRIVCLRWV